MGETPTINNQSILAILNKIQESKEELKSCIQASEVRLQLQIVGLNNKISVLEEENNTLRQTIERLERENKLNNIVIFGLEKTPREINPTIIATEISRLLEVNLTDSEINFVYPLGKTKNCPVKVGLLSQLKKKYILQNCKKLKNTGIAISHDLTNKQREELNILKKHLTEAKDKGNTAFIKGSVLVVDGQEYKAEELEKSEDEEEQEENNRNSSPPTPSQPKPTPPQPNPKEEKKGAANPKVSTNKLKIAQQKPSFLQQQQGRPLRSNSTSASKTQL